MIKRRVIEDGAVFVADAHAREDREEFFEFLQDIRSKKIKTTQLFLMGDIFDLLVGGVKYTLDYNKKYIDLLNELSKEIQIYYFEGNHDFYLKRIFPNIIVFPIEKQPAIFNYKEHSVMLCHGDIIAPLMYRIYTKIIRSRVVLYVAGFFDGLCGGCIAKKIIETQKDKSLCRKIENFEDIICNRIKRVDADKINFFIEGHFHQNREFDCLGKKYINLPSFACNKSFFIVQSQTGFKNIQL